MLSICLFLCLSCYSSVIIFKACIYVIYLLRQASTVSSRPEFLFSMFENSQGILNSISEFKISVKVRKKQHFMPP